MRKAVAHAALRAREINALEHERQIDGVDLHHVATVLHEVGEREAASGLTIGSISAGDSGPIVALYI